MIFHSPGLCVRERTLPAAWQVSPGSSQACLPQPPRLLRPLQGEEWSLPRHLPPGMKDRLPREGKGKIGKVWILYLGPTTSSRIVIPGVSPACRLDKVLGIRAGVPLMRLLIQPQKLQDASSSRQTDWSGPDRDRRRSSGWLAVSGQPAVWNLPSPAAQGGGG